MSVEGKTVSDIGAAAVTHLSTYIMDHLLFHSIVKLLCHEDPFNMYLYVCMLFFHCLHISVSLILK